MNTTEQQKLLLDLGHYKGRVDGLEGPLTRGARADFLDKHGYSFSVNSDRLTLATEQLLMRVVAGLEPGPIDGLIGPRTIAAREQWQAGGWRDTLMEHVQADDRFPAPVQNTWPTQSQVPGFFGKAGDNLETFTVPYPLRLAWDLNSKATRMTAHKKVKESTLRVLERVKAEYGMSEIQRLRLDVYGGTYNNRAMRGGKALSMHAYGIAHDFDPERNQLNWGRDRAVFAKPEYDAWWKAWTDEGWLSLGKARNFDWMHVQAARLG